MNLTAKRTFLCPVDTANSLNVKDFELPSDVQSVIGLAITANRRDLAFARGTVGARIAGEELIFEGEDASEYMFGLNHPARMFAFGELAVDGTDRRCQFRFRDTDVDGVAFSPYVAKIVVTYSRRSLANRLT